MPLDCFIEKTLASFKSTNSLKLSSNRSHILKSKESGAQTFGDVLSERDLEAAQAGPFSLVLIRALALPRLFTERAVAGNFDTVSTTITEAIAPRKVIIVH